MINGGEKMTCKSCEERRKMEDEIEKAELEQRKREAEEYDKTQCKEE